MRKLLVGVLAVFAVGCATSRNKAIVRGYMTNEVLSKGDVAALQSYFSEDVVFNGSRDINQQLARMRAIRSAFPDLHLT
ncbi:MAG: hypothetical protein HY216_09550, partial [Candidatus Rokubacteria bacterium]|nr:hypothetical protein [Candidatus Rokubacteria bacterium]